ncbi:hypothetical protein VNO78_06869 [Psophocarpus tetragonolobus]|uniref:Uncharacterized protein n=1 Tax=Psophocarpus tetragonolobus TaxID=3891 RepID=A0AAN9SSX3_PSOTE
MAFSSAKSIRDFTIKDTNGNFVVEDAVEEESRSQIFVQELPSWMLLKGWLIQEEKEKMAGWSRSARKMEDGDGKRKCRIEVEDLFYCL